MTSSAYNAYRLLTSAAAPLLPVWLRLRAAKGKEDKARMGERFGKASIARPKGRLIWLHAASVGEAVSVLPLIETLRRELPQLSLLITTGTVTSARLMEARLPAGVIHQYAPLDAPAVVRRFLDHWQPDIAFFVESEFWPNLIFEARKRYVFLGVLNARFSERSFATWQKAPDFAREMLACFDIIFAQSEADATRLAQLGAKTPLLLGNLKWDASPLPCDEAELLQLQTELRGRTLWLAASTHPGEEAMIADAHRLLRKEFLNILTIIVPRHPSRGQGISELLSPQGKTVLRSRRDDIGNDTQFYIADTLGELGLFYRLSEVVFMGGSLVAHGGQNPLEPARFSCALITGPHTHNFSDIFREMQRADAALLVQNAQELAQQVKLLLSDHSKRRAMQKNARDWVEQKGGATQRVFERLASILVAGLK